MKNILSIEVTELKEVIVGAKKPKEGGGFKTVYITICPGDDYSTQPAYVRQICAELHTLEVITAYQLSSGA